MQQLLTNNLHFWQQYCAQQFANTIGNQSPKIKFSQKAVNQLFTKHALLNELLGLNYEIVKNASLNGYCALGIVPINVAGKQFLPKFNLGLVQNLKQVGFQITELELVVDLVKHQGQTFNVVEVWKLENNEKLFVKRYLENEYRTVFPLSHANWNKLEALAWNPFNQIPYVIFKANPFGKPDLFNVSAKLLKDFDDNLRILKTDSMVNKGMTFLNLPATNATQTTVLELQKAIENPEQTVFLNKSMMSLLTSGAFQPSQGVFNGDGIIKKLNYYENLIKKLGFVRTNSSVFGTKNTNNIEIETLNADANDYLEMKANLLEIYWEKFLREVYLPYVQLLEKIDVDFEQTISVEVSGSTKYLKNKENVYVQNQDGILTNPNDLINQTNQQQKTNQNEPNTNE